MSIVDAVITWVDGSDSAHVAKRNAYLETEESNFIRSIPAGVASTRFSDNGELLFCIRSLRKFAPWIRTIYLVTDGQCPEFLREGTERESLGVKLVDHLEIFKSYEWALPTFNSISIETALHRIPGLSEQYLYLNDDFVICKPVTPQDFFLGDSVVLRGRWRRLPHYGTGRLALSAVLNVVFKKVFGVNRAMSMLQQMVAAQLAGFTERFFWSPHVPHPIRRSGLEEFFEKNPHTFIHNIRFRFRHTSQFVSTFLSHHLQIAKGTADLRGDDEALMICFNRDRGKKLIRKIERLEQADCTFLCLQSFEQASGQERARVDSALRRIVSLGAAE